MAGWFVESRSGYQWKSTAQEGRLRSRESGPSFGGSFSERGFGDHTRIGVVQIQRPRWDVRQDDCQYVQKELCTRSDVYGSIIRNVVHDVDDFLMQHGSYGWRVIARDIV